jgi:hypothetical protein
MPLRNLTIADWWKSYESSVVPKSAGATQRRETLLAFHAGAHAALCALRALGETDVDEDVGADYLESLWQESQAFGRAVGEGRA